MHVLWTSALEWQMILGQGAACCRQIRSMEKSILTILTLDGVRVENLPCFGIWGSYVIIRGKATSCFGGGSQKSCVLQYLPPYDLFGNTIFKDAEATLHRLN
jgi:hypothetical protein